jgi:hydroxymethylpyrimidine pyrophosphatase-like HAD family hydrolase
VTLTVLATDYDGTLAQDGRVSAATVQALERWRGAGRSSLLVTGRLQAELEQMFPHLDLFDMCVLENGGLLRMRDGSQRRLGSSPDAGFLRLLDTRGVRYSAGEVIVATWYTEEAAVVESIRQTGLDLQLSYNKGSLMVLPDGVNKASGLRAALSILGRRVEETVAVGDAENDLAFMRICGRSAAVANALPTVKEAASVVLDQPRGDGVAELIDLILSGNLEIRAS